LVLYNLWGTRRIHHVMLWSSVFAVVAFEVQFFVTETMVWRSIRSMGPIYRRTGMIKGKDFWASEAGFPSR